MEGFSSAIYPISIGSTYYINVSSRYYTLTNFYKIRQTSIINRKYMDVLLQ